MEIDIVKIGKGGKRELKDVVVEEVPLTIYLNDKELVTLLCSPGDLKELSAGFLYSAGILKTTADIESITVDEKTWISHVAVKGKEAPEEFLFKRLYTSGCGRGVLFLNALDLAQRRKIASGLTIPAEKILRLMRVFEKCSVLFQETGGVHSAALTDGNNILIFKEDIGRHHALDKVIGKALFEGLRMEELIVLSSGRVSSEIVFKVLKMRCPILVSRSAPTDQAVKIGREAGLTLVGFARGGRMNVYAGEQRIVLQ